MEQEKSSDEFAERLGRKAGQIFKAVRPGLRRAFVDAKPLLEKTGRQASLFARDHDAEIKQSAAKVVRARVSGPLGFLVDAVTRQAGNEGRGPRDCSNCQSVNPQDAKFCNQCGASLASTHLNR